MFQECLWVKRALPQQIVSAIESKYLEALHNPITNKIIQSIPDIFDNLFETYRDVTPHELSHLTMQVESMNFPLTKSVDTLFMEINDLGTITEVQHRAQQALATNQQPVVDVTAAMPPTCLPALEEVYTPESTLSANSVMSDITTQIIQHQKQLMQKMMEMMQVNNKP